MKITYTILLVFFMSNAFSQDQVKATQLIPYRNGNLWGYADNNKRIIIPPKFSQASVFGYLTNCCYHSDLAKVKFGTKFYLLDNKGKLIDERKVLKDDGSEDSPPQRDENIFTDSLDTDGSVINNGQLVIPSTQYQQIEIKPGYNRYFVVTKNDKKGIIDRNDHIVIPSKYESADYLILNEYYDSSANKMITPYHFLVRETGDSVYYFTDKEGNKSSKIYFSKYKVLLNFIAFQQINSEGIALWGLMNRNLVVVVQPKYMDIIKEEDYDLFLVIPFNSQTKSKSLPGYINEKGVEFFK